ncbi:hypothetical protein ACC693_38205, partial [Rhizobium ruizarguesonis]
MTLRMTPPSCQTYTQILKSTMLMGGSSLVNVALIIIRNKSLALLLGPEGEFRERKRQRRKHKTAKKP